MPRECNETYPGPIPHPSAEYIARAVSLLTNPETVFDQLIELLRDNHVDDFAIKVKLTGHVESLNNPADPDLGCCLYDTACCNLTQAQCFRIGGAWVSEGECVDVRRASSAKQAGKKVAKKAVAKGSKKKAGKK